MRELILLGGMALLIVALAGAGVRYAQRWWQSTDDAWPMVARVLRGRNRHGLRPERVTAVLVLALVGVASAVAVAVSGAAVLPSLVVVQLALAVVVVESTRGEALPQRIWSIGLGVIALAASLAWTAFCAQWAFTGGRVLATGAVLLGGLLCALFLGWADGLAHRLAAPRSGRRRPMPS